MTAAQANWVTVCASAKGGQGCTTIAAVLAVLGAHTNQPTLLVDTRGDAASVLGVADPAPSSTLVEAIANATEPADVFASPCSQVTGSTLTQSLRSASSSQQGTA